MEEFFETITGPWGLAAVLLIATNGGRRLIRGTFKEAVKAGMVITDTTKQLAGTAHHNTVAARRRARQQERKTSSSRRTKRRAA